MIEIKKINDFEWEIPKQGRMLVPGKIFASEKLLEKIKEDNTLKQAQNMATLLGVLKNIVVLPDAHQGYGACIGGVVAVDINEGIVSPGLIGYDLNCSVRLLKTNLTLADIEKNGKKEIVHSLFRSVPSGVGERGKIRLSKEELDEVLKGGAK